MIEKSDKVVVKSVDIQERARFFVDTELGPRHDLAELFERPKTAGIAMNPSASSAIIAFSRA
jgi:hypothetical protein